MPAARLSPAVLAELVARFGGRAECQPGSQVRFPFRHCTATAQRAPTRGVAEQVEIEIMDLAIGGIGFRLPARVTEGDALLVTLDVPGLRRQIWRCRVIKVHAFDGTHCYGGAQFEGLDGVDTRSDQGAE